MPAFVPITRQMRVACSIAALASVCPIVPGFAAFPFISDNSRVSGSPLDSNVLALAEES